VIKEKYKDELTEIIKIIEEVDATKLKTKMSEEKTMPGDMLYNPGELNDEYDKLFHAKGWEKKRVKCKYTNKYYIDNYKKELVFSPLIPKKVPLNILKTVEPLGFSNPLNLFICALSELY